MSKGKNGQDTVLLPEEYQATWKQYFPQSIKKNQELRALVFLLESVEMRDPAWYDDQRAVKLCRYVRFRLKFISSWDSRIQDGEIKNLHQLMKGLSQRPLKGFIEKRRQPLAQVQQEMAYIRSQFKTDPSQKLAILKRRVYKRPVRNFRLKKASKASSPFDVCISRSSMQLTHGAVRSFNQAELHHQVCRTHADAFSRSKVNKFLVLEKTKEPEPDYFLEQVRARQSVSLGPQETDSKPGAGFRDEFEEIKKWHLHRSVNRLSKLGHKVVLPAREQIVRFGKSLHSDMFDDTQQHEHSRFQERTGVSLTLFESRLI